MMKKFAILMLLAALSMTVGCGTTHPAQFYMLSPIAFDAGASPADGSYTNLAVGFQPIVMAEYLNRPQIVLHEGPYQIVPDEFHRWAFSLKQNTLQALVVGVGAELPDAYIDDYPWPSRVSFDYQVHVEVLRFDGQLNGPVTLAVRWTLYDVKSHELVPVKQSKERINLTAVGDSYEELVATMSRAVHQLSGRIATTIKQHAALKADKMK